MKSHECTEGQAHPTIAEAQSFLQLKGIHGPRNLDSLQMITISDDERKLIIAMRSKLNALGHHMIDDGNSFNMRLITELYADLGIIIGERTLWTKRGIHLSGQLENNISYKRDLVIHSIAANRTEIVEVFEGRVSPYRTTDALSIGVDLLKKPDQQRIHAAQKWIGSTEEIRLRYTGIFADDSYRIEPHVRGRLWDILDARDGIQANDDQAPFIFVTQRPSDFIGSFSAGQEYAHFIEKSGGIFNRLVDWVSESKAFLSDAILSQVRKSVN